MVPATVLPVEISTGYYFTAERTVCRPVPDHCLLPADAAFGRWLAMISEGWCPGCEGRLVLGEDRDGSGERWLFCPSARGWRLVYPPEVPGPWCRG